MPELLLADENRIYWRRSAEPCAPALEAQELPGELRWRARPALDSPVPHLGSLSNAPVEDARAPSSAAPLPVMDAAE